MPAGARVVITPRSFGASDRRPVEMLEAAGCELVFKPKAGLLSPEEVGALIADADAVIVGLDPIDEGALRAASRLRVIAKYGAGLDNIRVDVATELGIMVTSTPEANSVAVAELTLGLMLAVARRISLSDRRIRKGEWGPSNGFELSGKTLGIVGTGRIGKRVAGLAQGFSMQLLCFDVRPDRAWAKDVGAIYVGLDELLSAADVVTLHLPLEAATHHVISEERIASMKPGAILINTARGGIVDEEALYRALKEGRLAGAGLDVFEVEPPEDSPLKSLDSVVMTADIGSHTAEAAAAMGIRAAEGVLDALAGKRPWHLVNPQAFPGRPPGRWREELPDGCGVSGRQAPGGEKEEVVSVVKNAHDQCAKHGGI